MGFLTNPRGGRPRPKLKNTKWSKKEKKTNKVVFPPPKAQKVMERGAKKPQKRVMGGPATHWVVVGREKSHQSGGWEKDVEPRKKREFKKKVNTPKGKTELNTGKTKTPPNQTKKKGGKTRVPTVVEQRGWGPPKGVGVVFLFL